MGDIGQNIRRFRKNCGYTQEELALQLKVTSQAISRWESGSGMPDVSLLLPLSKALGVTLDALFGAENEGAGERTTLEEQIRKIDHKSGRLGEQYLALYDRVRADAVRNPWDFDLLLDCIIAACYAVRYGLEILRREQDRLEELLRDTERRAAAVIRYSNDPRLIDGTHTYMGWMYEFTGDYDKAREHILQLPAYASVQGQGNMLAQLALYESGFPAELEQIDRNLESLSDVICNDLERAMRDITQYADGETAERYRSWMMGVADAFGKLPAVRERWALCERRLHMQAEMRSSGALGDLDNTLPLSIRGTRK